MIVDVPERSVLPLERRRKRAPAKPRAKRGAGAGFKGRLLSESAHWGTPRPGIDLTRSVLGEIDFDAASSAYWNGVVGAAEFFDGSPGRDTLRDPWPAKARRVFCNPPGDRSGELVRAFWFALVERWVRREIDSAVWVGFSLEQWVSLQKIADGSPSIWPSPLSTCMATLVPRRRWRYLRMVEGAPPAEGDKPTHGSYLTLLPSHDAAERRDQLDVFRAAGRRLGELILRPDNEDVSDAPEAPGLVAGVVARVTSDRRRA